MAYRFVERISSLPVNMDWVGFVMGSFGFGVNWLKVVVYWTMFAINWIRVGQRVGLRVWSISSAGGTRAIFPVVQ